MALSRAFVVCYVLLVVTLAFAPAIVSGFGCFDECMNKCSESPTECVKICALMCTQQLTDVGSAP
ncbi:hypothetical protein Cni_G24181 [Canna indica]|uniref:Thionin-like protein n=1 Tax=Canna indica TaxID=4628 RepID=A0AAQ3KVI0_9LILI|nr:hypothetical protein Cni_G24181 [Canna indica]